MIKTNYIRTGNFVTLTTNLTYKGQIKKYLGYTISPTNKGRLYQVQWIEPIRSIGDYYECELQQIEGTFQLKERPK